MNLIDDYVSLCGNRHAVNQDHACIHHLNKTWLAVVSDGLGSRKKSQLGSEAVCDAAWTVYSQSNFEDLYAQPEMFVEMVHQEWLQQLKGENVDDYCATMLILAVGTDRGVAMQIGDGFISVLADNVPHLLFDDKSEHYINETDCFQERFNPALLRYITFKFDTFQCALLCSDGIEIGEMTEHEIEDFTNDFYEGLRIENRGVVKIEVRHWLMEWRGDDDKTAAYLINREGLE